MLTAFDILLVLIAAGIMLTGLFRRRLSGGAKTRQDRARWLDLVIYLLGHRKIRERRPTGWMHLLLVWGFGIFLLAVLLAQFDVSVGDLPARWFSLLLDLTGLAMICAALYFLIRRVRSFKTQSGTPLPAKTVLPMVILLFILVSGFWAEGARLNLASSNPAFTAPVGSLFAHMSPASPLFMQVMIRLHFLAALLFMALLPYCFMRHIVSSSLNVLHADKKAKAVLPPISIAHGPYGPQTVQDLSASSQNEVDACVLCGRCDEHCPARLSGKPLSPREIMSVLAAQIAQAATSKAGQSNAGMLPLEKLVSADTIWSCSTCMACVAQCPVFIKPMDAVIALRRSRVMERGELPEEARPMMRNLELFGDVNGKGAACRTEWAWGSTLPPLSNSKSSEGVLLWVGCSGAFHPTHQETTRDMVRILDNAGLDFSILGEEEFCCGDPARRLGREDLFVELAQANIQRFKQHDIRKIIVLCPHCFNTLKNEYGALGADIQVMHAVEFVAGLIRENKIELKYPSVASITIHDPCYLGRYNGIYESLREVCAALPGVTLKEMERSRETGFCCGGGGGRMWLHDSVGEKMNVVRARHVAASNAKVVGTACPYCRTMLEDGLKALEEESPKQIQVQDIITLVASSL